MKVGDWVLVTPDSFDLHMRGWPNEPVLCRIVSGVYTSNMANFEKMIRVKPIFVPTEGAGLAMYCNQCIVVAHSEVPDGS